MDFVTWETTMLVVISLDDNLGNGPVAALTFRSDTWRHLFLLHFHVNLLMKFNWFSFRFGIFFLGSFDHMTEVSSSSCAKPIK